MPRGSPPKIAITIDPEVHHKILATAAHNVVSMSGLMTSAGRGTLQRWFHGIGNQVGGAAFGAEASLGKNMGVPKPYDAVVLLLKSVGGALVERQDLHSNELTRSGVARSKEFADVA